MQDDAEAGALAGPSAPVRPGGGRGATGRNTAADAAPTPVARPIGSGGAPPGAFEAAFRGSPVALACACDAHCTVVLRNPAMNRIVPPSLDWRAWRLPDGSSPPLFEGGVAVPLEQQPLRLAAFRGQAADRRKMELRWPGREPVFLEVSATPLLDAAGVPCGAVASAVDITAETRAERARTMRPGNADADSRAKDELLGLMGHELRNPLNAIATAVEVLNRADPGAPEAHSARRIVGRQTRRLAEMIGELSEIGRTLVERVDLVRRPVDLGELLAGCVLRATPRAQTRGQRLQPSLDPVRVDADADRLSAALDRLLEESLRTAGDDSVVAVRLRQTDEPGAADALLEVGDVRTLGPASAPSPRFGRPDRSGAGLGIALTLVRHGVERHGGRIEVRHIDGGNGSPVFVVRLPALADARAALGTAATPAAG